MAEIHIERRSNRRWNVERSVIYRGFWINLGGLAVLLSLGYAASKRPAQAAQQEPEA
jgi:hypothetical protein